MKFLSSSIVSLAVVSPVVAEIYFKETFNDKEWENRWTQPTSWKPKAEMGKFEHTAGEWYADEDDKGIKTSEDARFYGLSAPMDKPFVSDDKDLIIQYSVKHEQKIDCGGAYIKLLPGGDKFDADSFGGDTPYAVMFGPDICGSGTKKTHVILHYDKKGENLQIKKDVSAQTDNLTHLYRLILRANNSFEVFVDNKSSKKGDLEEFFDFLEPKKIKDPEAKKPKDWVDEKQIPDPEDVKPEGYDDIPAEIPDPDAVKPDDWNDEDDGEWEPPMIDNPDYKGPWKPKMIPNPDYKGKWEHPMIDNPDYVYDGDMYKVCKDGCTHVGFEIWQVKSGTVFDDIIVTDSIEEAEAFAKETYEAKKDAEKEMYDRIQEEKKKKEEEEMEDMDDMEGMDDFDMEDFDGMEDEF